MDLISGGFYDVEKDGKLYLVYYHPKYCPIPQTQTLISSGDLPLFKCPQIRSEKLSPECVFPITDPHHNPVLPLYYCKNKPGRLLDVRCNNCGVPSFGSDDYYCSSCDKIYHRECVESPVKIKHPYHPNHILQFTNTCYSLTRNMECFCCGRGLMGLAYHCTMCQIYMHSFCAMKPIPIVIDPPKHHIHPLTFFPRQTSLTCDVCGLLRKIYPTYVCFRCNFVAHQDCMNYPRIIKISRHNHRISLTLSFPSRDWSCGVCRLSVNNDYGGYTCDKCNDYVVHPVCATGKNVWDGKELEGLLDEDDITQDDGPFKIISEGVILHFLPKHHLRLEVNILCDENNICRACALPICEGKFYSCKEDEFILHERCAEAPRRIQHALHPHPINLQNFLPSDYFTCDACGSACGGFSYKCYKWECKFELDVRCASVSEPFDFKGHQDPLFLALNQEISSLCHVCKKRCEKHLNCIKCNFIVCFRCITLPYKTKYKHDPHFLTLSYGEEVREEDWCEVCECNLQDTNAKVFYRCKECDTSFHMKCLFGKDPYIIPGQIFTPLIVEFFTRMRLTFRTVCISNLSRPLCCTCKNYCQGKIYKEVHGRDYTVCSMKCMNRIR